MNAARSVGAILVLAGLALGAAAPPTPGYLKRLAVFDKKAPTGLADLKVIQEEVKQILKKAIPATVGLRIGGSAGSGVIISEDGVILTAGHVSGRPGQVCDVFLSDGRVVKGKTLGRNNRIDSGMIKITTKGSYPYVELGKSDGVPPGKWCIAIGHPRGFMKGRTPVVRVGRVVFANDFVIRTDCALVGGDSGGPLFDFNGKLLGIHSRINESMEMNFHVPVNIYKAEYDRLAAGETIGRGPFGGDPVPPRPTAYMGVMFNPEKNDLEIDEVPEGSPASRAGVQAKDVILAIDGVKLKERPDLFAEMRKKKVGDTVTLTVSRDGKEMKLSIKLEARPTE
jgi:serine protease Do